MTRDTDTARDPSSAGAGGERFDGDVSVGFLVQADGALLLQLYQALLDVEVSLERSILLLDDPPQGVHLGAGRLVGLLGGHQGAIESTTNITTHQ